MCSKQTRHYNIVTVTGSKRQRCNDQRKNNDEQKFTQDLDDEEFRSEEYLHNSMFESNHDHILPANDMDPSNLVVEFQNRLENEYSNINDLFQFNKQNGNSITEEIVCKIYNFAVSNWLSEKSGDDLLDLISNVLKYHKQNEVILPSMK